MKSKQNKRVKGVKGRLKVKKIYKSEYGGWHTLQCETCYDMCERGYTSEAKYWDDLFADKLKPIKYRLVKSFKNLTKKK